MITFEQRAMMRLLLLIGDNGTCSYSSFAGQKAGTGTDMTRILDSLRTLGYIRITIGGVKFNRQTLTKVINSGGYHENSSTKA